MRFNRGDYVKYMRGNLKGVVIDNSEYYGWFMVKWNDGKKKIYYEGLQTHLTVTHDRERMHR